MKNVNIQFSLIFLLSMGQLYGMEYKENQNIDLQKSEFDTVFDSPEKSDEGWLCYCKAWELNTPLFLNKITLQDRIMYGDIYKYLGDCDIVPETVHITTFTGDKNNLCAFTDSIDRICRFDKRLWLSCFIFLKSYFILHEIGHLIAQTTQKTLQASEDQKLMRVRENELLADNFAIHKLLELEDYDGVIEALKIDLESALRGQERCHIKHPTNSEEYNNIVSFLRSRHYRVACRFSVEDLCIDIALLKDGRRVEHGGFTFPWLLPLLASILVMNKQEEQEDKEIYGISDKRLGVMIPEEKIVLPPTMAREEKFVPPQLISSKGFRGNREIPSVATFFADALKSMAQMSS